MNCIPKIHIIALFKMLGEKLHSNSVGIMALENHRLIKIICFENIRISV